MKLLRHLTPSGPAYAALQPDGTALALTGDPLTGTLRPSSDPSPVTLGPRLAPVATAPLIIGIGLNYAKHAAEGKQSPPERPVWFVKLPGSLQHPNTPITLPRNQPTTRADYEAELAIVLGKECRDATRENAVSYILGYTCANDVSARDWQRNGGGGQWCRGKTFATFCPLGPALVTTDEITDPNRLDIRTILNGQTLQDWNTSDMIFDVPTLIEFLSASMILNPGTVILTGTPHGVGFARTPPVFLKAGDSVTIEIEGIGRLTNPVVEEPGV